MYKAIVVKLKNVRPHPNADLVQLATCVGNQVVVGLDNKEGDLGVYFPSDGQLSNKFCYENNLYRDNTKNKYPNSKAGMFDDNRRVRAQKFRGEISDGFWTPIDSFAFIKTAKLDVEGFEFDELDGTPICNKYINPNTIKAAQQNRPKNTKKAKTSIMFKEHFDTEAFIKNVHQIKESDLIIITEKLHGTSSRVGFVLVDRPLKWYEKILSKLGIQIILKEWSYLNGTRRVVIEESNGIQFHDPSIRDLVFNKLKGQLRKGETFYLEIVGYEKLGTPIMSSVDVTKLKDKEFTNRYANLGDNKTMAYKYGCVDGACDFFVYRITMTNEDGHSIDYSWDDVIKRCNEIGIKYVPELARFTYNEFRLMLIKENGETIDNNRDIRDEISEYVDIYTKGASTVDESHIREGVCVRLESGLVPRVFKHKSYEFKFLEGIIKDSGVVDMEESN